MGMEATHAQPGDALLTISEAARLSNFSADTIRRYSDSGKLASFRTPANHRRFRAADVLNLLTPSSPVESISPEAIDSTGDASRSGDAA